MSLLDVLFPKKCVGCGKWGQYICGSCFKQLKWLHPQVRLVEGMNGLVSFWAYEGVARKAILKLKFRFVSDLVKEVVEKAVKGDKRFRGFVIVPVPLSSKRWRWRGFNQAEEIAKAVASKWHLAYGEWLIKVKDTGQQVGKTRQERLQAVKGSFGLKIKDQLPRAILLVDDVWTSGATMRECARVLKRTGVKEVWGLTLARRMWVS